MYEKSLPELSLDFVLKLFGTLDGNVENIESAFSVSVVSRDGSVRISGENQSDVNMAVSCIRQLERISQKTESIDENTVNYVISMVREEKESELGAIYSDCICLTNRGKPIKAKTVLTRPAVEAGEKLGFLPGDLQNKIDPYLRPLYDALGEMLGAESFRAYGEKGIVEIVPLAYMRGRTLDDAFIILDEAQNTTTEQMKMFLTRLGNNSKAVVTGDITQIDLPAMRKSGLVEAISILDNIEGIKIFRFSRRDVVRHPLVQKIIRAYEKHGTEPRADAASFRRKPKND